MKKMLKPGDRFRFQGKMYRLCTTADKQKAIQARKQAEIELYGDYFDKYARRRDDV